MSKKQQADEPKQADVVYALMAEDDFVYDQDNNLCVIATDRSAKKLIIDPTSDRYKGIISNRYMQNFGEVADIKHHRAALMVKHGETTKTLDLYVRIAGEGIGTPEATVYYDLCNNGDAIAIKPSKDGIGIFTGETGQLVAGVGIVERPLKFKDMGMSGEQVHPDMTAKIGDIAKFYDHIKIKPPHIAAPQQTITGEADDMEPDMIGDIVRERKKVLLTWVIYNLIPDTKNYPLVRPGIKLTGQPGSGKTFNTKKLVGIPDPIRNEVIRKPDDIKSLGLAIYKRWIPCFDNVKEVSDEESDMLCQTATGITISNRKLYTDSDTVGNSFYRPCIINGISDILTRPDAADRYLPIELQRLEGKENTPDAGMSAFNRDMPLMFGAALKILSITLDRMATEGLPEPKTGHRLIQFVQIGRIISDIIEPGSADKFEATFLDMMNAQESSMIEVNVAASQTADYIAKFGTARWSSEISFKALRDAILTELKKEDLDDQPEYKMLSKMDAKDFKRDVMTFSKNLKSTGIEIRVIEPTPGVTGGRLASYRLKYRKTTPEG